MNILKKLITKALAFFIVLSLCFIIANCSKLKLYDKNTPNKEKTEVKKDESKYIEKTKNAINKEDFDIDKLNHTIHDYLQKNIVLPSFGGQVFCDYDLFGIEIKKSKIHIYLWTVCIEYYGKLQRGTGSSLPIVLIAEPFQNDYKIIEHKEPLLGSLYGDSIRELFPERYQEKIFKIHQTEEIDILLKNLEKKAKEYYDSK